MQEDLAKQERELEEVFGQAVRVEQVGQVHQPLANFCYSATSLQFAQNMVGQRTKQNKPSTIFQMSRSVLNAVESTVTVCNRSLKKSFEQLA